MAVLCKEVKRMFEKKFKHPLPCMMKYNLIQTLKLQYNNTYTLETYRIVRE